MAKPILFTGSAVALVTPFASSGIDSACLERLIDFQLCHGTDAIVVCGTTGEGSTLSREEHREVIGRVVSRVAGRVPVIAGAGSNNTWHGVELSIQAEEAGADAILSVAPYYNKTSQKGLYEHFKTIAASVKIPIILYNVPSRTILNIAPATIRELALINNIIAIKECNLDQVGDIINLCGDDLTVYCGNDSQILPCLAMGGKGIISTMANIIPADVHELVASFFIGDINRSRELQLSILDLIKALFIEESPMPTKAALNLMGMEAGICRLPLVEMSGNNISILKQQMAAYGLIQP
ncbi:MAG: 4-hydroxy-tetrahydrodipicolinate synthase [Deltaproteobacteria bacterium]